MELHVNTEVLVPASIDAVWTYVVEEFFEHHARWDPAVVGMERLTQGPIRVGTRGRETRSFGGKQSAELVVTELERPKLFGFKNTSGPFALERGYRFESLNGMTQLEFRFDMAPKGVMRLLFPILRPVVARQVRANIARIPRLVAGATSSAPWRA